MTSEGTFRSCHGRTRQTSLLHSFLPVYPATNRLLSNLAERRQHLRSCERTDFFTWTLDLFPEELCCPVDACRFILLLIIKKKKANQELQALVPSTSPTGSQRLADDPTPALLFMSQLTAFNVPLVATAGSSGRPPRSPRLSLCCHGCHLRPM